MMLRIFTMTGTLVLGLSGAVLAQETPATVSAPASATTAPSRAAWAERGATFALRGAYNAIADAEARGSSSYLDAAKTHYRSALARYERHDAGAASEAMASAALARAALAEHPVPAPHDIPAPPAVAMNGAPMMRHPMVASSGRTGMQGHMHGMQGGMHGMHGGGWMHGRHGMHQQFDAEQVAQDAKLADTTEARDLAQKALDADVARTRAAFSGNMEEAMRQGRLASDLAMAVRSLAYADHPRTFQRHA